MYTQVATSHSNETIRSIKYEISDEIKKPRQKKSNQGKIYYDRERGMTRCIQEVECYHRQ